MKTVLSIKSFSIKTTLCVSQIAMILMAALVFVEVLLRWIFTISTMVSTEFAGYAMGIVFYWAAAKAIDDDVFVRMDVLYDRFKGKVKKAVILLSDILLLIFNLDITYYFFLMLENTFARDLRAANIYSTPLWIPRLIMFIGIAAFNIYLVCRTIEDFGKDAPKYSSHELRLMENNESEGGAV